MARHGGILYNNAIRDRASCETHPCGKCAPIEKTGAKHRQDLHTYSDVYAKLSIRQVIIGIGVG